MIQTHNYDGHNITIRMAPDCWAYCMRVHLGVEIFEVKTVIPNFTLRPSWLIVFALRPRSCGSYRGCGANKFGLLESLCA
jgi:hypothetical protein